MVRLKTGGSLVKGLLVGGEREMERVGGEGGYHGISGGRLIWYRRGDIRLVSPEDANVVSPGGCLCGVSRGHQYDLTRER